MPIGGHCMNFKWIWLCFSGYTLKEMLEVSKHPLSVAMVTDSHCHGNRYCLRCVKTYNMSIYADNKNSKSIWTQLLKWLQNVTSP